MPDGCNRGGVAITEGGFVRTADQGEQSVVGGDETGMGSFEQDGGTVGADARIDHGNEHGAVWEIAVRIGENDSAVAYVLSAYAVGEVDDVGGGINPVDDAAHHADVGIGQAEIGGQDYGRCGHAGGITGRSVKPAPPEEDIA